MDEGRDKPAPAPTPVPKTIFTEVWVPSMDLDYFTTDKFGILPRLAAATDTEIAVECLGDGTVQICVSAASAGDVEAAIAKLATLETPMVWSIKPWKLSDLSTNGLQNLVERPQRAIIFVDTTEGKPSGYRIVPYSDMNPRALKRVLVDPHSIETEDLPGLFAPVLFCPEPKTGSWVPPSNITSRPRVDANGSETIKTWENCQFPEIGNGESFSGFTATNQVVLYQGPISAAESSPPHPFLSMDKAQQVDDWVDDSATVLAPEEPRGALDTPTRTRTRTEEQPATQPGPSAPDAKSDSLDCKSDTTIKRPQRIKTRAVFVPPDTTAASNPEPNNSANAEQNASIVIPPSLESAPQNVEAPQNLIQFDGPAPGLKTTKKTREPINLPGDPLPASQSPGSNKPLASFGTGRFASVNSTSQTLLDFDDDDAPVNVAGSKNANEDLAGLEFDRPTTDHAPSLGDFSFLAPARPAQQSTSLLDLDIEEPTSALPSVDTNPIIIPTMVPFGEETALVPFNRDLLPKGTTSLDLGSPSVQLPPVMRPPSPRTREKNDAFALGFLKQQIAANSTANAGFEKDLLKIGPPTSRPESPVATGKTASDIVHESPVVDWRNMPVVLYESAGNKPARPRSDPQVVEASSSGHEKREDRRSLRDEAQSPMLRPQALKEPLASRPEPSASRPVEPREVVDRPASPPTPDSLYERVRKDNEAWEEQARKDHEAYEARQKAESLRNRDRQEKQAWEARQKAESLRNRAREEKQSSKTLPKIEPLQKNLQKQAQPPVPFMQWAKDFFHVFKPVLDASRCYPGALSLEFRLGLILVPPLSSSYKSKSINLEQLQRTFLPKRGLPAPATTLFNRLTASPADIDHIINIQSNGHRYFDSNATDSEIKYEFHCETKEGDLVITIDASGDAEMGPPSQLLGSVHVSVPGHVWDAGAVIQGHMKHGLGLGPEIEEAAQYIVTNLWVAPNRTRVRLFTRAPKDHVSIKKILLKRYSLHRYFYHPSVPSVKAKADSGLRLKVAETQDLPIIRHPIGRNVIEASCGPLDEMVKANRQWWEVSLVSPIVNRFLASNELLQPGESPDWSVEDLFGLEKSLLCHETARQSRSPDVAAPSVDSPGTQAQSQFAASIDLAGIGYLFRVTKQVIKQIDAVGYWNGAETSSPAAGVPFNTPDNAVIVAPARTEASSHGTVQPLAVVPYARPAAPSPEKSLRSVESTRSPFW